MAVANNFSILIKDKFAIEGESVEHKGEIPLLSISFSTNRMWRTGSDNTNAPEGNPDLSDIAIVKEIDKTSPKIFYACCVGQLLGKVVITGWTTTKSAIEPVTVITLENTAISSISPGFSEGGASEALTLSYTKLTWLQRDVGVESKEDSKQENNWDRSSNTGG